MAGRIPLDSSQPSSSGSRIALRALFVFAVLTGVIWGWNYLTLQRPLGRIVAADIRNKGLRVSGHYEYWINPRILIFDLRKVAGHNAPADVDRVLLQYADTLSDRTFMRVVLAHRGTPKFVLGGEDFRELGKFYGIENPVYTLRTLPEKLGRPDGSRAFGTWTGGLLGVAMRQMEDLSQFHEQWFLDDLLTGSRPTTTCLLAHVLQRQELRKGPEHGVPFGRVMNTMGRVGGTKYEALTRRKKSLWK